jgi:hypothetical protein
MPVKALLFSMPDNPPLLTAKATFLTFKGVIINISPFEIEFSQAWITSLDHILTNL